jgi:hypothetical protein
MELLINIGRGRCTPNAAGNTTWEDWRACKGTAGQAESPEPYCTCRCARSSPVPSRATGGWCMPMILISFNAAGDRRQWGALIKFLYDSGPRERE